MRVEIVAADRDQVFAVCGPVVVRIIDSAPTLTEHVDLAIDLVERVLETHERAGGWVVLHHRAPMAPPLSLRHSKRRMKRLQGRVCYAITFVGLGFVSRRAATATIALMNLLGIGVPFEVSLEASARRLAAALPELEVIDLLRAYDEAAARLLVGGG